MKKHFFLWSLCLLLLTSLAFSLSACGKQEEGTDNNDNAVTEPAYTCPLDGEELSANDDHGDYVFVVSIDNSAAAAPQSGLNAADLLIEVPAEGGINRFLAFYYHNQPDTIGPVRSARPYFYDLVKAYDAVFAHCGGSADAYEIIDSGTVKDIDEMSTGANFWRSNDRKAPHNLYTSYEKLASKAADRSYDTVSLSDCPSFDFYTNAEQQKLSFGGVSELTIPYEYLAVSYQWDEGNQNYVRYSGGEVQKDALDNKAVTAHNILVFYDDYTVMADGQHLDMSISSGNGLLLQDGTVTKINWSVSAGDGIALTTENGAAVKLIPGKTIIEFAKTSQEATYTDTSANSEGEEQ